MWLIIYLVRYLVEKVFPKEEKIYYVLYRTGTYLFPGLLCYFREEKSETVRKLQI
jgi:hypothetical protein